MIHYVAKYPIQLSILSQGNFSTKFCGSGKKMMELLTLEKFTPIFYLDCKMLEGES